MESKDKATNEMREYLRLKKLEENDNSEELIEEVYNKVSKKKSTEEIER